MSRRERRAARQSAGHPKEQWGSRLGVILAVAGSAVGLGNFLRFPGQAAQNGGGAFMIPYFLAFLLLGIPVGWAEWTLARYGGQRGFHSAPGILGAVGKSRILRYLGVLGVLIPLVVSMYYVLIESWCLRYFVSYLAGALDLGEDPALYTERSRQFFTAVTGADRNGVMLGGALHTSVIFWLMTLAINIYFVSRGLSRGIERFVKWAMPVMVLSALVVLARVLTLGAPDPLHPERSVLGGLGFMWNPDLSKLGDFTTWLAASGQIFFSLSVGFGVIINYASYLRKKDDVLLSSLTASATNEVFEVGFGGLITIPAAFVFLGASAAYGSTFGLGFQTLPVVFAYMGPLGRMIGAVWFFMLFLAAITSSLSLLFPVMTFLREALGLSRRAMVTLLSLLVVLGSLWVIYFSKDLVALDTMDFWVGTTLIFLLATIQSITFAWVFGVERGIAEAEQGSHIRVPRVIRFLLKYVTPCYLIVVFLGFCLQNLPGYLSSLSQNDVARWTVALILIFLVLLLLLIRAGEQRWREIELEGNPLPKGSTEGGEP